MRKMYKLNHDRYNELKYFCRQYQDWKKKYIELDGKIGKGKEDVTAKTGTARADYMKAISLIEMTAKDVDPDYYPYIMKAVTTDCSYREVGAPGGEEVLKAVLDRFFWELSRRKGI